MSSATSPSSSPTSSSHNYNFAMQKYILLKEQHAELSTHLDQIRPTPLSPNTSAVSLSLYYSASPSTSPTRYSSSSSISSSTSSSPRRQRSRERSSRHHPHRTLTQRSDTLDTITDEETLYEISAEEQRLADVNEGIKRALTEMLNCEAVRGDMGMRMWVQTRLMETEKELRSGRRRKSSACSD